jgi:2-polyprenyl-6-methoxyphenol hydroxylase-like FAD-dependent oxidoreductase
MTSAGTPSAGTPSEVRADVGVVGAGPTGLTLAILLAQRGHTVTVLERWADPYPLPRAVHFDHEVGRLLQACGIGDDLRAISEPADIYEWRNASGDTLLRFGRHGDGPSGWPASSMFCQPELEALLEQRVAQLPGIELRRGVEVTAVDDLGDHVVVRGADGTTVQAAFVVGCDGANSTVRSLAGLPVHDLGFFYDWLIVDVILDEPRVYDPLNLQVCDPARPTTAVSGGPGRRRWEFMKLPGESLEELNDERRAWELLGPWDVHAGNARLERHAVYTFQARYAERWRSGRIFLAGDAAHQMPPFAGQGLCAGVRDAGNLAWKLDLVLAGQASEALLDTYQEERLAHARGIIEFSMELGKVICVPDPAEAAARDAAMSAAVGPEPTDVPDLPGPTSGLVHPESPHAGSLFVQGGIDGRPFDDVHGAGWRLVSCSPDAAASSALAGDLVEWFGAIGGKVVAVDGSDSVFGRWFGDHGTSWALQRPDFHLYGTAPDATGAGRLLADLRSQLLDPSLEGTST